MKDIYVIDVIEKCGGRLVCGDNNAICDNFKIDTREIKENDTFVGIKGENFDGNAMYEKAFETGLGLKGSSYTNTMMVEHGIRLYFAKGSERNVKLTTKEDLDLFKAMLELKRDTWLK